MIWEADYKKIKDKKKAKTILKQDLKASSIKISNKHMKFKVRNEKCMFNTTCLKLKDICDDFGGFY